MSITTDVVSMEQRGPRKNVKIRVSMPKATPQVIMENRARFRALVAVGLLDSMEDTMEEMISRKELMRITTVRSNRRVGEERFGRIVRMIEVGVWNEGEE